METTRNTGNCTTNSIPMISNPTSDRICGLSSNNATVISALETCCNTRSIENYRCVQFCTTSSTIFEFNDCLSQALEQNSSSGLTAFCQGDISANITASLASAAATLSRPIGFRPLVVYLMLIFSLISNVSAKIVPTLSATPLSKRQSSACSFEAESNYTTVRSNSVAIGSAFSYTGPTGFSVVTNMLENNRTVNGTSAAEPEYDEFFGVLQNQTNRLFPALSGVELMYNFVPNSLDVSVIAWTPLAWCINGTASGCGDALDGNDDGDTVFVDACGPLFTSDDFDDWDESREDIVQGVIGQIIVS